MLHDGRTVKSFLCEGGRGRRGARDHPLRWLARVPRIARTGRRKRTVSRCLTRIIRHVTATPDRQWPSAGRHTGTVALAVGLWVELALAVIDITLLPPNVLVTIGVLAPLLCALRCAPRDELLRDISEDPARDDRGHLFETSNEDGSPLRMEDPAASDGGAPLAEHEGSGA